MLRTRFLSLLVAGASAAALVLVASAPARAQAPLQRLSLFKKLETSPDKDYPLTEDKGPWLILCSTFLGKDAEAQAKQLVLELRRDYKVAAYIHEQKLDLGGTVTGRGLDKYGRPKQMKHAKSGEREEFAVLVGDFPSGDDPEAKRILEKIRYAKPDCLNPEKITEAGQQNSRALAGWRAMTAGLSWNPNDTKSRGPMGKAFMVTNPMFPDDYFKPKGIDPLVEKMNENVEFGLLKSNGKYTVKVATFQGSAISMPKEVKAVESGEKRLKSRLEIAAINAHLLTIALREKGYEAYEFHDHASSIVTVGSFASYGTPRDDGKIEINPAIHQIMQTFGANQAPGPDGKTKYEPKSLAQIPFDIQPTPVEVPQRTVSTAFNRSR